MRRLVAVVALALSGALSAHAEAPDAKDAAVINLCLAGLLKTDAGPEKYEAACLLKVADRCMGADPTSVSSGREIECLDRERLVWDQIINDSYKSVMAAIEPDQATKLREVQKAWIHSRDHLHVLLRLFSGVDGLSDDRILQQSGDCPSCALSLDLRHRCFAAEITRGAMARA
jgi:uncharacterized protein YecT (DUF1311 family)